MVKVKAKCRKCGKITALRQPYGEGTAFLPRRHYIDGELCIGSINEAELIEIPEKQPNKASSGRGGTLPKSGEYKVEWIDADTVQLTPRR